MQQLSMASRRASDPRKLVEDVLAYVGILKRGWKLIAIGVLVALTAAVIYLARSKTIYKASARLLVIQQGGRPIQVGGGNDPFQSLQGPNESLVTHVMLIRSPIIAERAVARSGLKSLSVPAVIGNLTVKLPNESAKIIEVSYKAEVRDEAIRVMNGVIESYDHFLKDNYQKNTNDVISLIVKARDDLNLELRALEQQYLEYRQKRPAYSADDKGRTFIARRLDHWDQAMNQILARTVQLRSQLALGRKLAGEGADAATITNALNQLGGLGGSAQAGTINPGVTPVSDSSYDTLGEELAEVETARKTAEKLLSHLLREHAQAVSTSTVSDNDIVQAFNADPEVADVRDRIRETQGKVRVTGRLTRSPFDPSVIRSQRHLADLDRELKRLWVEKRPIIAESLAVESNQEIAASIRLAKADLISLKAREAALREHRDEVVTEQLGELREEHAMLGLLQGEDHPQVRQLAQEITRLESSKATPANRRPVKGRTEALLDSIEQSLEATEVMRTDLQRKFDEDLAASKTTEIGQLEEVNLRNNLDRQRTLFHSVVDQLKEAQLSSDFGSVSAQVINPPTATAERPNFASILGMALALGCGLGGLAAFVADTLEARVRTLSEIRKLIDLPVIGLIPQLSPDQLQLTGAVGLLTHENPRSLFSESYKSTRTAFESMRRSRQAQVLLVSSALSGDGKSTTASNLAITLAHAGRRVLLIDADLRRPSLDAIFKVPRDRGLSDALESGVPIGELIRPTLVKNLDLVTTGPVVAAPAELLASTRLDQIVSELRNCYDLIIIDSSPLLAVTDPSIIAAVADGVIMVVRVGCAGRHEIERAMDLIKTHGTPALGLVVNGVKYEELGYAYGYGGYGSYGQDQPQDPRFESPRGRNGKVARRIKSLPGRKNQIAYEHGSAEVMNAE